MKLPLLIIGFCLSFHCIYGQNTETIIIEDTNGDLRRLIVESTREAIKKEKQLQLQKDYVRADEERRRENRAARKAEKAREIQEEIAREERVKQDFENWVKQGRQQCPIGTNKFALQTDTGMYKIYHYPSGRYLYTTKTLPKK